MNIYRRIIASMRDSAEGTIESIIGVRVYLSHKDALHKTMMVKDKSRFGVDLCDE
jgi:ppGpp synthetase/RelA/SpoT-type nucleotidyltranferase